MVLKQQSSSQSVHMVEDTALGAQQRVAQSVCLPHIVGRGLLLYLVPPIDMVASESVMDIQLGDYIVLMVYQADYFTHAWSAEQLLLYHTFTLGS